MKYALIIGNNKYNDPKLAQLKTPAADSQALAKILDDQTIGSFDEVKPLINQTETQARRAISTFLANKKPDDLVLLYFSGHGVLDDRGRLYLALKDTQIDLLKATSIPSSFVADEMDSCRSKRQILILDCCHSGAFARGVKGEQRAITETTFEGSGFGRVVLTASDSTQYALEGDQVVKQTELSLFTHFLLKGLKTGEADTNNDGHISLDEWYDYTYANVISETPRQVPHKWSYNQQGDLIIARNPYLKKKVMELPSELLQALESSFFGIRESAVTELGNYLHSRDPEMVQLAISNLEKMKQDDSRRISSLAERLLSEFEPARTPHKVTLLKQSFDAEPKPADVASDSLVSSPKMTGEMESPLGVTPLRSVIENETVQVHGPRAWQKLGFDLLFWLKWIAIAVLGFALLNPLNISWYDNSIIPSVPLLFAVLIGAVSLVQWLFFRDQLERWWIAVNMAGGVLLGGLTLFLYYYQDWWGKNELFRGLAIGNFIVGAILIRRIQEKPKDSSSNPWGSFIEANPRRNTFALFLSIFLVLYAFVAFLGVSSDLDFFYASSSLKNTSWTFYGITSIFAGISFVLTKEAPRNFGFVTLAVFLFLNGIIIELFDYEPESSKYFFFLPGTMSLLSSVFFASHRETWQHRRSILLCLYLISVSLVYFGVDAASETYIFSIITAILALLAAIFYFFRK